MEIMNLKNYINIRTCLRWILRFGIASLIVLVMNFSGLITMLKLDQEQSQLKGLERNIDACKEYYRNIGLTLLDILGTQSASLKLSPTPAQPRSVKSPS